MLNLFEKNDIHASWATLGLLYYENLEELMSDTKGIQIPYLKKEYSPYPINKARYGQIPFEILSGKEEIDKINQTSGQELASHTFSHYYTLEEGQNASNFQDDLNLMKVLDQQLKSIVFPRNQVNDEYLKILAENGYSSYRGNQKNKLWQNSKYASESIIKKGKRYLDAYYFVSDTEPTKAGQLEKVGGMINIPASRFFRPYSGKNYLEKKKLKRICNEMEKAAANGEIYHLWWHPHNFALRTDEHFLQLEVVLRQFKILQDKYGFRSLNMTEISSNE